MGPALGLDQTVVIRSIGIDDDRPDEHIVFVPLGKEDPAVF